jgi:hypothetical protein
MLLWNSLLLLLAARMQIMVYLALVGRQKVDR